MEYQLGGRTEWQEGEMQRMQKVSSLGVQMVDVQGPKMVLLDYGCA